MYMYVCMCVYIYRYVYVHIYIYVCAHMTGLVVCVSALWRIVISLDVFSQKRLRQHHTKQNSAIRWVAVKELELSYHNGYIYSE